MKYPCLFLFLLANIFLNSVVYADENWVAEEVLIQLQEIRKELSELRKEISKHHNSEQASEGKGSVIKLPEDPSMPTLGDTDASIFIMEFSDYQCPFCKRHAQQTMPKLKENYILPGKVQYGFMDFPLGFHSLAKPAAIAAHCAGKQHEPSYWAFHDHFFSGASNALKAESYEDLLQSENLSVESFKACLTDPNISKKVDAAMSYGSALGVSGTPAFVIGIKKGNQLVSTQVLSGAQPYTVFSQIIDRLLNQS